MELNEYQKAAVLDESPVCLVRANVGSGKTTVLIEKIRYLHEKKGVPLERMTILTFTNKAADEIGQRLQESGNNIGTFHSVAFHLLQEELPWRSWAIQRSLKSACRRRSFSWRNS